MNLLTPVKATGRWIRNGAIGVKNWILARFEGAQYSTSRSYIPGAVQSARFDCGASPRIELVRKSRYFEKNNAIVNRLADLFECYTVGCGLQLNPSSSSPEWNKKAKAWLEEWALVCDLSTRQNIGTLQSLIARTWFIDGEVFIVLARGESGRPRLQIIEGHLVSTPPTLAYREGIDIIDGIQIDKNGRPIAYYIAEEDGKGQKRWGTPKSADVVIHVFEPSRPGQYRGLPFCYPVINDIHDLDDLQMLEQKAAKDASEITNVFKTKTGELPPSSLLKSKFSQNTQISTGATVSETKEKYYHDSVGGRSVVLYRGDEMDQHRSERPSVAMKEYWRFLAEKICAGVGIPYVLVFPDSIQGTVYRGALDMAATFFRARSMVIADALRRIYQSHVMLFAKNEPTLRDAPGDWKVVSIHPPRAVNVDVGRNSSAMIAELQVGATNYELIYSPLGLDWREQFDKLAEQQAYARKIGLVLEQPQPQQGKDSSAKSEDDEPIPARA